MNDNKRRRTPRRFAPLWLFVELATLLFTCDPATLSAASPPGGGLVNSISGMALSGNGHGLSDVVVTLEPSNRLKAGRIPVKRVQTEQATLLNRGGRFVPETLVVTIGTTASFRSWDGLTHEAKLSMAGREFARLGLPANGLDVRYTFRAPGLVTLTDERNPHVEPAHIVVVEHHYFSISDTQGRFTIYGVAPGTYTFRAWHKALGSRTLTVTVDEAEETRVKFALDQANTTKPCAYTNHRSLP